MDGQKPRRALGKGDVGRGDDLAEHLRMHAPLDVVCCWKRRHRWKAEVLSRNLAEALEAKTGLYICPDGRVKFIHEDDVKRDALGATRIRSEEDGARDSVALAFARRRCPDG